MSIILSWENPQETFLPQIHRAEVWRAAPDERQRFFKICSDAPWGTFEDKEGVDPCIEYRIDYVNALGSLVTSLYRENVRAIVRANDIARLIFSFRDPNGIPSAGREIEISNDLNGASFYHNLLTNRSGHAEFFAVYKQRIQIRIDGWTKLLDCAVPCQRDVNIDELRKNGTLLPLDSRGLV